LKLTGVEHVTVTAVAEHMGSENINKMAASRRITTAERGGWLINKSQQRNVKDLDIGEPLPAETGLPTPEMLTEEEACNSVTPHTVRDTGSSARVSPDETHTQHPIYGTVNTVTPLHASNNGNGRHADYEETAEDWISTTANNTLFKK